MKRIISALVAMLMLLTMVPVFAAIEVDTASPSLVYMNSFEGIADASGTSAEKSYPPELSSKANVGLNVDNPANFVIDDEQFTITRVPELDKNALAYLYFSPNSEKAIESDVYAIGFDLKFSDITSNTASTVWNMNLGRTPGAFEDSHQGKIDRGEWYVGEGTNSNKAYETATGTHKASKTSWCFRSSGKSFAFSTKKAEEGEGLKLASNDQPAIYFGSAELLQDTFYTLKIYINNNTRKYYAVIIDGSGNVLETGVDGTIQKAFSDVSAVKCEMYHYKTVNVEASVTYDNIFFEKVGLSVEAPSSFEPNAEGTVTFKARIPSDVTNPAVYINDTFVENLTLTQGKTDYIITSALPEGIALGDVEIEIRGTQGSENVSASAISEYVRKYEKEIEAKYADKKITGYDGETPYYGISDTRTDSLNPSPLVDGLFEIGAKIKRANSVINIRLRSNTIMPTGGTSYAVGALFDGASDPWKSWDMGALGVPASDTTNWHDLKLVVDYRENAFENAQPYSICIDDNTPRKGTFKMHPESTINGFIEFGMYNVYYKDVYIKEIVYIGADEVIATYNNGTTATYEDEALITPGLSNLTFALNTAFDSANAIKFVDESGNDVSGVTLSMDGANVVITPDSYFTIPTGSYKLVIDKAATFGGEELGANLEVPVELSAPATVMEPAEGEVVSEENVTITLFAEDAEKVAVFVNDVNVKTFEEASANGFYSFNYEPSKVGKNYIDVYTYAGNDIKLASSTFVWSPYKAYNEKRAFSSTKNITTADSTYADGGAAKLYTATIRNDFPFVNLETIAGHRIGVREFDMKVGENTWVYTELGLMTAPGAGTGSGSTYPDVTNIAGTSGYAVFDKNNKICGTDYTWEAGQWYHIKHIINMENMTASIYVTHEDIGTDVKVLETPITTKVLVNNKETAINYTKYRFILKDKSSDSDVYSSVEIANPHTYELKTVPVASVLEETITEGTDSVDVTLDKAYDDLDTDFVSVTANGEYVDSAVATVSEDGKTITVSGLAGIKAGTRVEISVMGGSMFSDTVTDNDAIATVFVADANNLCVLPLNVESTSGTDLFACSKYINGSGNTLNSYLIVTEFDTSNKVKQTSFTPVTILAGETGLVYSYNTVTSAQGCKVMLWNSDLSQLAEVAKHTE